MHTLEDVAELLMLDLSFVFDEGNHEGVVIDVVFLEEFAIRSDLLPECLRQRRFKFDLLVPVHPILVLELVPIPTRASVETAFEVIDLLYGAVVLRADLAEDVLHADEVNGVDLLLVDKHLQLVQAKDSDDEGVGVVHHVLVVVLQDVAEKDIFVFCQRF